MREIFITEEFQKLYQDLPGNIQRKAEKQEKLFRQNPFHPSLHTEKLEPKGKQVWSFRIDKNTEFSSVSLTEIQSYFLLLVHMIGYINLNFDFTNQRFRKQKIIVKS